MAFHLLPSLLQRCEFLQNPWKLSRLGSASSSSSQLVNTKRQPACTLHKGRYAKPLGARTYWEISCDRRMPPAGISGRKDEVKAWRWDPRNSVKCVKRLHCLFFFFLTLTSNVFCSSYCQEAWGSHQGPALQRAKTSIVFLFFILIWLPGFDLTWFFPQWIQQSILITSTIAVLRMPVWDGESHHWMYVYLMFIRY